MTTAIRILAAMIVVSLVLTGPLAPALAQQPSDSPPPMTARGFEAGVANVFLVPGRAITCVVGGAVGIALLAVTLGTAYRAFSAILGEGCGGKWMVNSDDMLVEPSEARPFFIERDLSRR